MIHDLRDLPADTVLDAELCIVGGGPAGLTLARALAGRERRVLVLESGGPAPAPDTQALAEGALVATAPTFPPLHESRARALGGTAHLWNSARAHGESGFRCGPLDPIDFERRDWLPHSTGWPFGRETLDAYYERAQQACGLGPWAYDGAAWADASVRPLPLEAVGLTSSVWQFGAQHTFTGDARAELARRDDVHVYLHAGVTALETSADGATVTGLRVARPDGSTLTVRAGAVVLAAGGIENARLLLLSRGANAAQHGLGNEHDLVGRYFMEHQWVDAGTLVPADRTLFARAAFYDTRRVRGTLVTGKLDLAGDVLRRERLLNVSAALVPSHRLAHRVNWDAAEAFDDVLKHARRLRLPPQPLRRLARTVRGADFVAVRILRRLSHDRLCRYLETPPQLIPGCSWSDMPDLERRFHHFHVVLHCEQAPHPDNRIVLDERRDAFGVPRARLHWAWREADVDSVRRALRHLAGAVQRGGLGTLRVALDGDRPRLRYPGLHHHMGTTRMHPDARHGVVDEQGRVHGVRNLWIAGCSVFPSGGYINPTLTIVALALRLADHLRARVGVARVEVADPGRRAAAGAPAA